jgi:hypothetical protein
MRCNEMMGSGIDSDQSVSQSGVCSDAMLLVTVNRQEGEL